MANDLNLAFGDARRDPYDCRPSPVCDPRPACPACGGLECLCRPRFFAGQLLSEEDLNRLDHYIVAKNRLHNRHLFGTGVVCGLEVVCAACDPAGSTSVVVKPGYALSPCGNDIVVCHPETVNVCDLITRCRPRPDDCHQPDGRDDRDARQDEQWVLAICYREKPSRGITALRGDSCDCKKPKGSDCGCGCGGHGKAAAGAAYADEASCGCGGARSGTARMKAAAKAGPRPPQCEPTLTCEGYSFAVYRIPPGREDRRDPGALIKRFICCLLPLVERLTTLPPQGATAQDRERWLKDLIQMARDFLRDEGLYDCEVTAKLNGVAAPAAAPLDQYVAVWTNAVIAVLEIIASVFQKCLCAALLPPCPPPELNDCVPIATVTIAPGKCRVRHVCNISNRRTLITWPALQYWFSWLPLFSSWGAGQSTVTTLIEKLCCTPVADWFGAARAGAVKMHSQQPAVAGAPAGVRRRMAARPLAAERAAIRLDHDDAIHPFTRLFAEAMLGGPEANAASVLLAALGARGADDEPLVSDAALEHPGQAILIHQVLAPALKPLLPFAAAVAGGGPARDDTRVDSLARTVEDLRARVQRQDEEIKKLRRR